MKIIKPYTEILTEIDGKQWLKDLEKIGRICYKSENRITDDSSEKFIKSIIKNGHESIIEHKIITVKFVCDRGISHEIVRHRLASYTQESTRYCNYSDDKFGNELTFIQPCFYLTRKDSIDLINHMERTEEIYNHFIKYGSTPQRARAILPNSIKTELIMTANLREWRHFLKVRTHHTAHPQMRELTIPLLKEFKKLLPIIFDDIGDNKNE